MKKKVCRVERPSGQVPVSLRIVNGAARRAVNVEVGAAAPRVDRSRRAQV